MSTPRGPRSGSSTSDEPGTAVADYSDLPEAVRLRLAELAAEALADLPKPEIPRSLRAVATFAPAKRAKLGASALLTALATASFRSAVVRWCRDQRPTALLPPTADVTALAVASVLTGDESAPHYVELVARRAGDAALRAERDSANARAQRLDAEVARLRDALAAAQGSSARETEHLQAELDRLRKRLREQGGWLRRTRDDAEAVRAEMEQMRVDTELEIKALIAERERERDRAEAQRARALRAQAEAETARQSAREARAADEVRLSLLVETLDGAIAGLRRELALREGVGTGVRPADTVRGASPPPDSTSRIDSPAALDRLLALPAVHVIVDGYNVTKTGYPDLPLGEQRERLTRQLTALAARTSAEVTLVFDGAGVVAVPVTVPKRVRVLFSDPGVLADDVIRELVVAEPEGRPVVVVTSDRAVAGSVRRRGAYPVASAVLLARLDRI